MQESDLEQLATSELALSLSEPFRKTERAPCQEGSAVRENSSGATASDEFTSHCVVGSIAAATRLVGIRDTLAV